MFIFLYRSLIFPLSFMILAIFVWPFSSRLKAIASLRFKKSYLKMPTTPPEKNVLWFHCSSGEFEYALPVIREIKNRFPKTQILVTYFSTSFVSVIEKEPLVDLSCPLPWDFPGACQSFLDHFKPSHLLIARTDIWPEMLLQCQKKSIPKILFAAQFTKKTHSLNFLKKSSQSFIYNTLDKIYCVNRDHKEALIKQFNLPAEKIKVTGDTRYDQVIYRLENAKNIKNINPAGRPHFILGSSYVEDENFVLKALDNLLKNKRIQLTIVPHHPTPENIQRLQKKLPCAYNTYSKDSCFPACITLIDKMGILAESYLQSDFSFIGGSLSRQVHSVMEALSAGNLVFIGPKHDKSPESIYFKKIQLEENIYAVSEVSNPASLRIKVENLIENPKKYHFEILRSVQKLSQATKRLVDDLL